MRDALVSAAWRAHAAELHRFAARRTAGAAGAADDLLQELFLRLLRSAEWPHDPRAWLFRALRNLIVDHHRAALPAGHASDGELPEPAAEEPRPDPYAELEACLPGLLARLPGEYREALDADLDGVPQREIAARQGLTLSGAKSRVQRARRLLHRRLEECCDFEFGAGRLEGFTPRHAGSCVLFAPAPSSGMNPSTKESSMHPITIEWRHLEVQGETCERCTDTGTEARRAVEALNRECLARGVAFELRDVKLDPAEIADSNAILIGGRRLEELLPESATGSSDCASCGTLLDAPGTECRTVVRDGQVHETLSAALIREAACALAGCCAPAATSGCGCG